MSNDSITFCIATAKNEKNYTLGLLQSLENNTEFSKHEVLIFIDSDNQNTYETLLEYKLNKPNVRLYRNLEGFPIGSQRNVSIMFSHASKNIVVYLQSDMVVSPDFDKYFILALDNNYNRVVSAARIEPPIHPASPEKIVRDFGLTPEEFRYQEFVEFAKALQLENRPLIDGHFAPFGTYKTTYFNKIGGFDSQFRCSREDSDFIIRLKANNIETVQTWNASVYHYTCVSSRGTDWYKNDEQAEIKNQWQSKADQEELKRFIRKWGYFGHDYRPKFKSSLRVDMNTAPNIHILAQIEPYFDKIIINEKPVVDILTSLIEYDSYYYANKRWGYTPEHWEAVRKSFMGRDLKQKILFADTHTDVYDVEIETDMFFLSKNFSNPETSQFIQNYNNMLSNLLLTSPLEYKSKYQVEGFTININDLIDTNKEHLDNTQYLFDTSAFKFS